MAVVFELVVNAGADREVATRIGATLTDLAPLPAGRHRVALHPPLFATVRGADGPAYQEISLVPVGVGHKVSLDAGTERLALGADELSELGHGLYEVLRACRGYRVAMVGWDPESFLDVAELQESWADELRQGDLAGLVLSDDAIRELATLGTEVAVEPFAAGTSWMPYQGTRPV